VVVNRSMSLDGFIAGPGDAMDWIFDFVAPDEFPEIAAATGAMLVGRRTDEVGSRMDADKERGSVPGGEGYPSPDPRSSSPIGRPSRHPRNLMISVPSA
jgi:RibD C-terminal domain